MKPDWLAINAPDGSWRIAFRQIDALPEATWPDGEHPQMAHLDFMVNTVAELDEEPLLHLRGGVNVTHLRPSSESAPPARGADS
ncbi:hypothetical protein [Rhodococcus sp. AW25M09]|uniref:hypothetical protein n=1 Tax=Rhodococcus sp. AW25M09 TaxID=1268303 RepID=UPI0003481A68|nr:hypothetical protein [Rhodococcus sp. AW25M09]